MATIKKGILGGFSGTVGTVVGASWRGMDVIRSRPKPAGSNPSPLQVLQRQKFALAIKFQNALRTMQSRLYGDDAGVKSRVNLAASYLLREVITDVSGTPAILMDKVLITKGELTGFQNLAVAPAAGGILEFAWQDNSSQMLAQGSDIFCSVVYEPDSAGFNVQEGPEIRSDAVAAVPMPAAWLGKTVHIYAFFQNEAQNEACNSVYLGTATLA